MRVLVFTGKIFLLLATMFKALTFLELLFVIFFTGRIIQVSPFDEWHIFTIFLPLVCQWVICVCRYFWRALKMEEQVRADIEQLKYTYKLKKKIKQVKKQIREDRQQKQKHGTG